MIFHQIATERDRQSYLPGCPETCMAVVIDPDINLLDVRERDSYKASHIPGAILIPRGQLE